MKTKFQILSIAAFCLFFAAFISPRRASAQPNFSFQNWCQIGGKQVILANLPSTTLVQQSFPRCTVSVYLSGTTTLATIFSSKTGTVLSNPFTAGNDAYFVFYAAPAIPYDITISGGGMPAPFTFPDVIVSAGGGGTGCTASGTNTLQMSNGSGGCLPTNSTYDIGGSLSFSFGNSTTAAGFQAFTGGLGFQVNSTTGGIQLVDVSGGIQLAESTGGINISGTSGGMLIRQVAGGLILRAENDTLVVEATSGPLNMSGQGAGLSAGGVTSPANDLTLSAQTNRIELVSGTGLVNPVGHADFDTSSLVTNDAFVYTLKRASGTLALTGTISSATAPLCANGAGGIFTDAGCIGGGSGVTSINSTAGAYTFNFSAGAGSCSGTTCTFTGSGSGGGSVISFAAPSGSWPSWLVPTVTNSTTTPSLAVASSLSLANVAAGASPTGLFDFSGATALKVPIHTTATAVASGEFIYDSTNGNMHMNVSSTDLFVAGIPSGSPPTNGHCAQFTLIAAWWEITDAGAPCGSGGGAVSSVSNSDGTLTISPTTGTVVASLALGHANTWTALQTHSAGINFSGITSPLQFAGSAGTAGQCPISGGAGATPSWGSCGSGGSGISGLTLGFIPLAGSATTITANSHLDDGVTTAATITSSEPVAINDGTGKAGNIGLVAGTAPGAAPTNTVQINAPTAVTAYAINLPSVQPTAGNTFLSCTAANPAVCSWGGTVTAVTGTSPIVSSGGTAPAISCPTCVTSAAALTNNAVVIGGGSQASSTIGADTTTTHALFATAGAPAFRAVAVGDIPTLNQSTTGNAATATNLAGTFTAHQFYGNNAGSTAAPAASLIGTNDWSPNAYVAGAGSVNAMTACPTPAITALVVGLEIDVLPNLANTTTTPTLNLCSFGAKTVTKLGTAALVAGDYSTTAIAKFIYDGTGMQLQNPQTSAGGGSCGSANIPCTNTANSFTTGLQSIATGSPTTVGQAISATSSGAVTPAFVQGRSTSSGASSPRALAFTSNVTAGNAIVVAVYGLTGGAATTYSATDTLGNTYTSVATPTNAAGSNFTVLLACGSLSTGADTVTVTAASGTVDALAIHEYSGVATTSCLDTTATLTNFPLPNPSTVGPITTGNDLIFTVLFEATNAVGSVSATGYTNRQGSTNASSVSLQTADKVTISGSQSAVWNTGANGVSMAIIGLLPSLGTLQSADLSQWKNESGVVAAKVDSKEGAHFPVLTGTGTTTIAPGASGQVGTGATAVCTTNYVCDSFSGTITLTTGTGVPTAGAIATVTFPATRTKNPSCAVTIEGGLTFLAGSHSASTTVLTFSDGVAVATSTVYTLSYVCGGS